MRKNDSIVILVVINKKQNPLADSSFFKDK